MSVPNMQVDFLYVSNYLKYIFTK